MTVTVTFTGDVSSVLAEIQQFIGGSAPAALLPGTRDPDVLPPPPPVELTPKRGRGRPPKAADTAPEPPEAPQEAPAEEPAPKPAPKPAAAPAPAPAAAGTLAKGDVAKVLMQVVKTHGVEECSKLCREFGAPNLSEIDPAKWPALVAAAQARLEG